MAEAHKRILALVNGEHGRGKRQRVPVVLNDDEEVKEEGELESGGSEGEGAVVAVAAMEEPQINLMFAVSRFHCEACLHPLKPPIFKVRFSFPLGNSWFLGMAAVICEDIW